MAPVALVRDKFNPFYRRFSATGLLSLGRARALFGFFFPAEQVIDFIYPFCELVRCQGELVARGISHRNVHCNIIHTNVMFTIIYKHSTDNQEAMCITIGRRTVNKTSNSIIFIIIQIRIRNFFFHTCSMSLQLTLINCVILAIFFFYRVYFQFLIFFFFVATYTTIQRL